MINEKVIFAFSHDDKIYGLTTEGYLAEWNKKDLKWTVRGSAEVLDHATMKKITKAQEQEELKLAPAGRHGAVQGRKSEENKREVWISFSAIAIVMAIMAVLFIVWWKL